MNNTLCKIFGIIKLPVTALSIEELRLIASTKNIASIILGIKMCKLTELIVSEEVL